MLKTVSISVLILIYSLNLYNLQSVAKNVNNSNIIKISQYSDIYSNDLSHIEKFLFGRTYAKESVIIRLARIEGKLYRKNLAAMSIADRMNNILRDYQSYGGAAISQDTYCSPKKGIMQKIKDTFIGYPIGYTPQIEPSPYINTYGPSYMQGFYGSNGWRNHNIYEPSYAATRLHIADW